MSAMLPENAALLRATIQKIAPALIKSNNVGATNDDRDLYYLIDYLTFAVDRAYPEIPCARGCGHCCKNQVFRVTALEWARVRATLLEWDSSRREAVLHQTRRVFGAHRDSLETMAELWSRGERVAPQTHAATPKTCPLLDEAERCSIYDARPAICRGFGYFSATVDGESRLLICHQEGPQWVKHLEDTGVAELPMPNWNPIQRHIEGLNAHQPIKPLPLWLLDMADEFLNMNEL